jgi:DNA-binding beta-propeller fold protein YncE
VLNKIKLGENPDAILYDPASKRVFTFNGRSNDVTAIDAAKGEVVARSKWMESPSLRSQTRKAKSS